MKLRILLPLILGLVGAAAVTHRTWLPLVQKLTGGSRPASGGAMLLDPEAKPRLLSPKRVLVEKDREFAYTVVVEPADAAVVVHSLPAHWTFQISPPVIRGTPATVDRVTVTVVATNLSGMTRQAVTFLVTIPGAAHPDFPDVIDDPTSPGPSYPDPTPNPTRRSLHVATRFQPAITHPPGLEAGLAERFASLIRDSLQSSGSWALTADPETADFLLQLEVSKLALTLDHIGGNIRSQHHRYSSIINYDCLWTLTRRSDTHTQSQKFSGFTKGDMVLYTIPDFKLEKPRLPDINDVAAEVARRGNWSSTNTLRDLVSGVLAQVSAATPP